MISENGLFGPSELCMEHVNPALFQLAGSANFIDLAENKGSAIFSGRREGFALYFARLVRPIWKLKVTCTRQV